MITVKDQVSMMFGIGVAEQLDEAGLLVRDSRDKAERKLGVVDGREATHWKLKLTADRPNQRRVSNQYSMDRKVQDWINDVNMELNRTNPTWPRVFEKTWPDSEYKSGHRTRTMLVNVLKGEPWATVEWIPCVLVEIA